MRKIFFLSELKWKTIRTENKYDATMAKHRANTLELKRKEFTKPKLARDIVKRHGSRREAVRHVVDCQNMKRRCDWSLYTRTESLNDMRRKLAEYKQKIWGPEQVIYHRRDERSEPEHPTGVWMKSQCRTQGRLLKLSSTGCWATWRSRRGMRRCHGWTTTGFSSAGRRSSNPMKVSCNKHLND